MNDDLIIELLDRQEDRIELLSRWVLTGDVTKIYKDDKLRKELLKKLRGSKS